jgi:DHA1 family multidrug resistance protein-like MFS transporter
MWELLWLSSVVLVLLFFLLPETSADNILLRRASRLRAITGNQNYKSKSEIQQANMSPKDIAFDALIKPWEMNALDPAILFSTVYVALCYAVFYSFFEAFPQVFPVMHGFSSSQTGLTFISIFSGLMLAIPAQLIHFYFVVAPSFVKNGPPAPEFWLKPSLISTAFIPIGLFIFGEFGQNIIEAKLSSTNW